MRIALLLLRRHFRRGGCAAIMAITALSTGRPAAGAPPDPIIEPPGLGRTVEELLTFARKMSPEIRAQALAAEAAEARIVPAGAFPDPMLETELRDITGSRRSDGAAPERINRIDYRISQNVPLWGKRELRRDAAEADAATARQQIRAATTLLDGRIKTLFAEYYAADRAITLMDRLAAGLDAIADAVRRRYALGPGDQRDALGVDVEKGRLASERVVRIAAKQRLAARLNSLLDRPVDAPLADPERLRPLPASDALAFAPLLARAESANPELAAQRSAIRAAEANQQLAKRTWYPDLGVRLSAFEVNPENGSRRFEGYEVMLFSEIPLQWETRRAQERDAAMSAAAAQARLEAVHARLRADLTEELLALQAAVDAEAVLANATLPRAERLTSSLRIAHSLGRADLPEVLEAEQALKRLALERLELLVQQQSRLAMIEQLIGGEL